MLRDTLEILRCPCCPSTTLELSAAFRHEHDEVVEGLLDCPACGRWYRIEQGIPDLVRDALRETEDERAFLARHGVQRHPIEVNRTEADQRIVDEGRHWGRFMARFWDVADRSIFDLRIKGTHPSFFVAGILEPDDRDTWRPWSMFPARVGEMCFPWLHQMAGKRGVDVGCGGGQFGLEAARRGLRIVGFDPSFEEVMLARRHAREQGVMTIDYVRGEPANPPFRDASFDLLMAKDSLHHVPDLEGVMPRLVATTTPNALLLIHEHVAKAPLKTALMSRLMPRAVAKIRSRWPKSEVPPELLRDSANEDVSAHLVRSAIESHATRIHSVESLFLAEELEMVTHFAFGKRVWLTRLVGTLGWWLEQALIAFGDRQHLTWLGRRR